LERKNLPSFKIKEPSLPIKKLNYIIEIMLKKRKSIILLLIPVITSNSLLFCSRKKEIEPIIFQVSPDKVWSGEDTPIEITGKNFIEGAKLNLKEDKKEATIFSVYLLGDGVKIDIPYLLENEEKIKSIVKKSF